MRHKRNRLGLKLTMPVFVGAAVIIAAGITMFFTLVPRVERLCASSYLCEVLGNFPFARMLADEAVTAQDTLRSRSYHFWLMAHHDIKDVALADLDRIISFRPDKAGPYLTRAFYNHSKGNLNAAERDYSMAIDVTPEQINGYLNRADVRRRKGEYALAVADCDEALGIIAQNQKIGEAWKPFVLLNRAEAKIGLQQYESALDDLNQSKNAQSEFDKGEVEFYLAKAYEGLGDAKAASEWAAAASKAKYNPDALPEFDLKKFAADIRY